MNRTLTRFGLMLGAFLAAANAHALPGAAVFVAGEAGGNLEVFNQKGGRLDGGQVGYNVSDGFAVGDVDGDGADEIVIAGDVSGDVEIRELGDVEHALATWPGNFTVSDALAVGNVLPGNADEIVIAGDASGAVDIFNMSGAVLAHFDVAYTILDGFALGDVDGDGFDEILVAGDASGYVDVFKGDGTQIAHLALGFTVSDGFASGNPWGFGPDRIVIAGDAGGDVQVFDLAGTLEAQWDGGYSIGDSLALGDVDGDGKDEIVIAGDVSGDVDVFDVSGNKLSTFDGDYTVLDGFAVGRNPWPDQDADGLLDSWELNGFDGDGDTIVDVNLPAMGCRIDHKDLLLELDWVAGQTLERRDIQPIKNAFAVAPVNAGGTPNPDGQPGINLIIDTGSLTDPTAREGNGIPALSCANGVDDDNDGVTDGADSNCVEGGPGGGSCSDGMDNDADGRTDDNDGDCREGAASCSDGVDNNGDGLTDANDPLCLVGDNFGGGNQVSGPVDPIGSDFYAAKAANFSPLRRRIFRYGVAGSPDYDTGGRGEIGGNDFVEYNHDAGTIMHEFGHNLDLHHGGADDTNCKPNFVSVMNYDHQFGIKQTDGSAIIDYSPPRRADLSRGTALATIDEYHLDEDIVFDSADTSNMFIHVDHSDAKITSRLNQRVDWTGDGDTDDLDVAVNVDDESDDDIPAACENITVTDVLEGHDDWSVIQFTFRGHADYDDAAVNPVNGPEPTLDELQRYQRTLNRANLQVTMTDSADPAVAGETLQLTTTVRNLGPNPTSASHVSIELPAGVTHVSTPGCLEGNGVLSCDIDMFFPGEERTFVTTVSIDADLVHLAGHPVTLSTVATVRNVDGDDLMLLNNAATEATLVKAVADLEAAGVTTSGAPAELLIGDTATFTLHELVTSHGPSSPMDTLVTRTVSAPADAAVTLDAPSVVAQALAKDEVREIVTTVQVACTQPGKRSFTIASSVSPARPDDSDPNAANDDAVTSFDIECVVPVSIRVRPAMNEGRQGLVPVEVRSNEAGEYGLPLAFDATLIDATSVRFASKPVAWAELGGAFEQHGRTHGGADRTLHFAAGATGLTPADAEGCVKGTFTETDGDTFKFFGCDTLDWTGR